MIHEIGDTLVQPLMRTDQVQVTHAKAIAQKEADRKLDARPIEKTDEQAKVKLEEKKDQSKSAYTVKGKRVVFEKYGKDGEMILQLPSVHTDEA
ncbi:MAG: hypothetical protein JEZ11_23875 [Desulfobacterales bacterium]|nr:hypothetical protein [Desulfobacterales bacterium]